MPDGKLLRMVCTAPTTFQSRLLTSPPQLGPPVRLPLPRLNGHARITTPLPMMSSILKQISAFRHICRLQFPLRFPLMKKLLWKMSAKTTLSNTPQLPSVPWTTSFRTLIALPLLFLPTSQLNLMLPLLPFPSRTASSLI